MPKETIFRTPGFDLELGWSRGGEATARVVPSANPHSRSETFGLADLDNAISVLQKIRKQVFETSMIEALLDSKFLTQLARNAPNSWAGGGVAMPNVPNSEAYITSRGEGKTEEESFPLEGITQFVKWDSTTEPVAEWGDNPKNSAGFLYLREKIVVSPTTHWWGRQVQRTKEGRLEHADTYRAMFIADFLKLTVRFNNFLEIVLREAVFGTLTLEYDFMSASIDYAFPEDRFVHSNNVDEGIVDAMARYLDIHGFAPTHAYCTKEVFDTIENPDQYGLVWSPGAAPVRAPGSRNANKIAFVNWTGQPLRVIEGPSADWDAPKDHTGKFAKGWRDRDPSTTQILLEWNFVPVWDKPQVVVLDLG